MKTVGVLVNVAKPHAQDVLVRLDALAAKAGLELICEEAVSRFMPSATIMPADEMTGSMDVLMVLGGDGSMLKAARGLQGHDTPIIGVNIGSLGFLTSVAEHDLEHALACLAGDKVTVSERRAIQCCAQRNGESGAIYRALNDIVIRSDSARVVTLGLSMDGEDVCEYVCDGLIISTPTGSTGHNLSAGGPILHPEAHAMIVSLICPHTLSSRPLVVADGSVIAVRVLAFAGSISLTVDGQVGEPLQLDDVVDVSLSPQGVRVVQLPEYSYFSVLRQKLGWRGSHRGSSSAG